MKVEWLRVGPQDHLLFRDIRQLMPLEALEKEISLSINGENEMNDRASNELYNIRRQIRDAQSSIREILERLIRKNPQALQDQLVIDLCQRGDHFGTQHVTVLEIHQVFRFFILRRTIRNTTAARPSHRLMEMRQAP